MAARMAIFLPVSTPDLSTSTNGLRELSTGLTAIQVVFFQNVTDLFVYGFGSLPARLSPVSDDIDSKRSDGFDDPFLATEPPCC
jgi:hypothetical protein